MSEIGFEDKLFFGIISRKVKEGITKEKLVELVSACYDIAKRQNLREVKS